jgi:hypothetical protein
MKKRYKIKLIAIAMLIVGSISNVNATTLKATTVVVSNDADNWLEVKNENGIKISFTSYQLDNNSYLKIRFENLTSENLDFVWSLKNKENKILVNRYENQINSDSLIDFSDLTMPILITPEETLKDFSITINAQ